MQSTDENFKQSMIEVPYSPPIENPVVNNNDFSSSVVEVVTGDYDKLLQCGKDGKWYYNDYRFRTRVFHHISFIMTFLGCIISAGGLVCLTIFLLVNELYSILGVPVSAFFIFGTLYIVFLCYMICAFKSSKIIFDDINRVLVLKKSFNMFKEVGYRRILFDYSSIKDFVVELGTMKKTQFARVKMILYPEEDKKKIKKYRISSDRSFERQKLLCKSLKDATAERRGVINMNVQ